MKHSLKKFTIQLVIKQKIKQKRKKNELKINKLHFLTQLKSFQKGFN